MAGGTSVPPQDSRCEPWSGQRKDFWLEKEKTCGRTKRSRRSDGEVSLDNADAVIEGCPNYKGRNGETQKQSSSNRLSRQEPGAQVGSSVRSQIRGSVARNSALLEARGRRMALQ